MDGLKAKEAVKRVAASLPPIAGWGWCWSTTWPWLVQQATAGRQSQSVELPADGAVLLAIIGLFLLPPLSFASYVVYRIWCELEEEERIYKQAAVGLQVWYGVGRALAGRWRDRLLGVIGWWGLKRRYVRELPRLRSVIDARGLVQMDSNRLELDDLYVELRAATRSPGDPLPVNPISRTIRKRAPIWDHLRYLSPGVAVAMIGAPGSGKTTLLKHMLLTYARNRQWRYRVRARVPIFVELRKLPRAMGKARHPILPDILQKILKSEPDLQPLLQTFPADWVANLLKGGRCILLLDGLDEIPDSDTRRRVAAWLDEQINHPAWRANLFLVTSRPAGYMSAPLTHALTLEVQPFDLADTQRFIEGWYLANETVRSRATTPRRDIRERARVDARRLIERILNHSRLAALTGNPLLLTMICLMNDYGQLPGSRSQLYKEICEVHLVRWRRNREVKETWNGDQKLAVLRPLAMHLMSRGASDQDQDSKRITTDEMLAVSAGSLDEIGVASSTEARKAFFLDLQQSSGLWLEWEKDRWGFAHLSFQEYLCADQWFTNPATQPPRWEPLLEDSWWRETLLLFATKVIDIRPLIRAALGANTSRSLTFLLSLESDSVAIPQDLAALIHDRMGLALASTDQAVFLPAGEAWFSRQQDNYVRIHDQVEMSGWITEAEFRLFLEELPEDERHLHYPPPAGSEWTGRAAQMPITGVWYETAVRYCEWLGQRLPQYHYRLPQPGEVTAPAQGMQVFWLTSCQLENPSAELEDAIEQLQSRIRHVVRVDTLAIDLKQALARDLERDISRALEVVMDLMPDRTHDLSLDYDQARALAASRARARAVSRVRARTAVRMISCAIGRAADHNTTQTLALTLAFAFTLDSELASRAAECLGLDIPSSLGDLYAIALGLAYGENVDLTDAIKLASASPLGQFSTLLSRLSLIDRRKPCDVFFRRAAEQAQAASGAVARRARLVAHLIKNLVMQPDTITAFGYYNSIFLAYLEAIRDCDPALVTRDMERIEMLFRLLQAREVETGVGVRWEGIRIIRLRPA